MLRRVPIAATLLLACTRGPSFTDASPSDVRAAVAAGRAVLVDVREREEWSAGHLAAARAIPLSVVRSNPRAAARSLPGDRPVYLHCAAGPRARKAAALLLPLGIDARPLKQGYVELVNAGFPAVPAAH
jgi:rhodanese-related sulfurtransferase